MGRKINDAGLLYAWTLTFVLATRQMYKCLIYERFRCFVRFARWTARAIMLWEDWGSGCGDCEFAVSWDMTTCSLVTKFIHSFSSLSYDRSKASSKRTVHIVLSRASSFKWEYPLLSLRSSSSFLYHLPRLPLTSIPSFIFPLVASCRRQFLHKIWPIQGN